MRRGMIFGEVALDAKCVGPAVVAVETVLA
jgi:hypothetical protein